MLDFAKDNFPINFKSVSDQPDWFQQAISNIEPTGWAAEIYDANWQLLWVSPELKIVLGNPMEEDIGYGNHIFEVYSKPVWQNAIDVTASSSTIAETIPYILYNTKKEDADRILEKIETEDKDLVGVPGWRRMIKQLQPQKPPPFFSHGIFLNEDTGLGAKVQCMSLRIHDEDSKFVGTLRVYGPGMRASVLSLVARGDEDMFERMSRLVTPGQQRVAVLFADIDGSTFLSKQLPTSLYFQLVSAITKKIDEIIITHRGIVGKHVGDGTSAFFLAEDHNSVSAAARAAIKAGYQIQAQADRIIQEFFQKLRSSDNLSCKINVGIHWGDTVYMGQIVSGGRLEVTALGDQVNECARIEQAASKGQVLASKELIERLDEVDARALNINNKRVVYTPISEFHDIPEKSRNDAGNLSVVDLSR